MQVNAITNQIVNRKENNGGQRTGVIPPIGSRRRASFSGAEKQPQKSPNLRSLFEHFGALTALIGLGLDFFGKNLKMNKHLPLTLEIIGCLSIATSFFVKDGAPKQ